MTPVAADWVYDVVLTPAIRKSYGCDDQGPLLVRICSCQYGPCGWCSLGQPGKCAHRWFTPAPGPDTYVLSRTGGALTGVWRTGKACAWRCPGPPAVDEPLGQLELFAVGGAR